MKTLLLMLGLLVSFVSLERTALSYGHDFTGRMLGGTSTGFMLVGSEAAFLTNVELDYFIDKNLSLGGQMLFGISDFFLMGPQVVGKYTFDINNQDLQDLRPHLQALMGMVVVTDSSDTEAGFLGGFGFGADYFIKERFSLGTDMLFEFSNEI